MISFVGYQQRLNLKAGRHLQRIIPLMWRYIDLACPSTVKTLKLFDSSTNPCLMSHRLIVIVLNK